MREIAANRAWQRAGSAKLTSMRAAAMVEV
jgi:hypothetical protein